MKKPTPNFSWSKSFTWNRIKLNLLAKGNHVTSLEGIGKMSWDLILMKLGLFFISDEENNSLDCDWFELHANTKSLLQKSQSIKEYQLINSFRGERIYLNMPVRGQRTRTNARTRRKRKVI